MRWVYRTMYVMHMTQHDHFFRPISYEFPNRGCSKSYQRFELNYRSYVALKYVPRNHLNYDFNGIYSLDGNLLTW